jgi:hypothetical protein
MACTCLQIGTTDEIEAIKAQNPDARNALYSPFVAAHEVNLLNDFILFYFLHSMLSAKWQNYNQFYKFKTINALFLSIFGGIFLIYISFVVAAHNPCCTTRSRVCDRVCRF